MAIILPIILFISSFGFQSPEFLVFEHIGEQDKPIKGIIIIESKETYEKTKGFFEEYGVSTADFQVIKWFILHEKLSKNRKCNETRGGYGAFSIQLFEEKDHKCFYIEKAEQSVDFFYNLFFKVKSYGMSQELQNGLEDLVVQLIGADAYKKMYNPFYQNNTINKIRRSPDI